MRSIACCNFLPGMAFPTLLHAWAWEGLQKWILFAMLPRWGF